MKVKYKSYIPHILSNFMKIIHNKTRHDICSLCGSTHIIKIGDVDYGKSILFSTEEIELDNIPELWQCQNCHSNFIQNVVPEIQAIELYSRGSSSTKWSREPWHVAKPIEQLECLKRYFTKGKKVLDFGCNTGELLDFAQSLGCETTGVEFSLSSHSFLKEKKHRVYSSFPDDGQKFDVITAFDVIEHLYDVPSFLEECKSRLEVDGTLILLTGNADCLSARICQEDWWYFQFPEHIVFPSREYFVRYSGLRLVEWIHTYATVNFKRSLFSKLVSLTYHTLRRSYRGLPSIFSDHVLVILKKEI